MQYRSLKTFAAYLEGRGELKKVTVKVDPRLEVTEIADRMVKHNRPALLFEDTGTEFPLLINAFGSDARMAAALGAQSLDDTVKGLAQMLDRFTGAGKRGIGRKLALLPDAYRLSRWMPAKKKGLGQCQQVVMAEPDLYRLPILTCWPHDGGPYITLPLVHTADPLTGHSNTGMYRMQVFDKVTTGMHWHLHKDGASHYRRFRELGIRMPVTVTLGGDPVYTYAATAPLPSFMDEFILAGVIRRRGVKLVKSLTNDIWIPEDADIVIEGYVDPVEELRMEGPFGDHTGFYSLPDLYPVFHVTAITHRKDAIYPATIVGIPPQEDLWLGKATEKIFLLPLRKTMIPELIAIHMPAAGVFHNIVLASIRKTYPGQPAKVAASLWSAGQMMFNKIILIFDENTDLQNEGQVLQAIAASVDPEQDIFFSEGPLDVLDHSSRQFALGSKMGVDITHDRKFPSPVPLSSGLKTSICSVPGVVNLSDNPVTIGVPLIMVYADKGRTESIRDLHCSITSLLDDNLSVRFVFYLDPEAAALPLSACLWLVAGNIDPQHDSMFEKGSAGYTIIGFDGTRKTFRHDRFERAWPNLTTMNTETIALVDRRWRDYNLGSFIESPSLPYLSYQQGESAVAEQGDIRHP